MRCSIAAVVVLLALSACVEQPTEIVTEGKSRTPVTTDDSKNSDTKKSSDNNSNKNEFVESDDKKSRELVVMGTLNATTVMLLNDVGMSGQYVNYWTCKSSNQQATSFDIAFNEGGTGIIEPFYSRRSDLVWAGGENERVLIQIYNPDSLIEWRSLEFNVAIEPTLEFTAKQYANNELKQVNTCRLVEI